MNDPLTLVLVFVGGAGGSAIRWLVGIGVGERHKGSAFPLATFLINVSGAFLMGFLSTLLNVDWKDRYGSNLTALVLTGVLGGYTTFSGYQLDTANLYKRGGRAWALLDRLGIERAAFCGLSLGGMVAIWLAARAPQRLSSLVLCSTSAHYADHGPFKARETRVRTSPSSAATKCTGKPDGKTVSAVQTRRIGRSLRTRNRSTTLRLTRKTRRPGQACGVTRGSVRQRTGVDPRTV